MGIGNPRQVVLVSTEAELNILGKRMVKDNLIPVAWHMPVSKEPMMYAISIGKTRFSHHLIHASRVFIVNFMPYEFRRSVLICGRTSGAHSDKFQAARFTREEGKKVHSPRVKEALGYVECEVIKEIDAGDHVIFLGKVLHAEIKRRGKRLFQLEGDKFTTTLH